jgi:hypothetical protein
LEEFEGMIDEDNLCQWRADVEEWEADPKRYEAKYKGRTPFTPRVNRT